MSTSVPTALPAATKAKVLVVGIGNPSRGDDALGPMFIDLAGKALAGEITRGEVELLTDFQLQIEHTLDLQGRERVVFVDASVHAAAPFEYTRTQPGADHTHTTHAMSPEALLGTYRDVMGEPPLSFTLAIRGEQFELGEPLTAEACTHLDAAVAFFCRSLHEALHARTG